MAEQSQQTDCGTAVGAGTASREGRLSLPTQETTSPIGFLLDNKPSRGLHQEESSCQKECSYPNCVPTQEYSSSGLGPHGVPEPAAAIRGRQRDHVHEVRAGGWSAQPGGSALGGAGDTKQCQAIRITACFGLEGTFHTISFQPPAIGRDANHHTRLLTAPSSPALNASREGASTASLGNLFQCLTTLTVMHFSLIFSLNQPTSRSKPFPLVLSQHALVKCPSPAFL